MTVWISFIFLHLPLPSSQLCWCDFIKERRHVSSFSVTTSGIRWWTWWRNSWVVNLPTQNLPRILLMCSCASSFSAWFLGMREHFLCNSKLNFISSLRTAYQGKSFEALTGNPLLFTLRKPTEIYLECSEGKNIDWVEVSRTTLMFSEWTSLIQTFMIKLLKSTSIHKYPGSLVWFDLDVMKSKIREKRIDWSCFIYEKPNSQRQLSLFAYQREEASRILRQMEWSFDEKILRTFSWSRRQLNLVMTIDHLSICRLSDLDFSSKFLN